jgi:tetratricopeptide (TPR) repeat protein
VLARIGGFDPLHAEDWTLSGGLPAVPKRRFIAALVALEYTASRPGLSPVLFEWGAKMLRETTEPQPLESLWLRASIALAEGRGAWPILRGLPPGPASRPAPPSDPLLGHGHVAYALSRFPDDPYAKLAPIVALEGVTTPDAGRIALTTDGAAVVTDQLDAQMLGAPAAREGAAEGERPASPSTLLELAAAAAETLTSDPVVGAEARLRLGYVQLRLGRRDLALQQFKKIHTKDPFVAYLGHLFTGWTLAKDGQVDAAVSAYRAALGVVPHARSASTLLTAVSILSGRLGEAEAVATELMTKPAVGDDPWLKYLAGDYREYPALIARLREGLK